MRTALNRPLKRRIALLLVLCLALSLCGCGRSRFRYGVNTIEVLIEQDYSLAFRNNDPLYFYVTAALSVLAAEGRVSRRSRRTSSSAWTSTPSPSPICPTASTGASMWSSRWRCAKSSAGR